MVGADESKIVPQGRNGSRGWKLVGGEGTAKRGELRGRSVPRAFLRPDFIVLRE